MEQSVSVVMALLMVVLAAAPVRGVNTFDTGAGTVYKLSVTQDVWLESGNRNYNNYEYIIVSKIPEYPNKRSLVQFEDLPSSCPSKNVTSAKMYLYYIYSHKPSFMSAKRVPFIPRYLQVHLVKKPWNESQATSTMRLRGIPWSSPWLALDGTDAEATPQQGTVTMFPFRPSGQFVEFDVTDAVTNWSSGVPNNGLVIRATNELVLGRSNRFASNGNSDTSKHAYVLVHCSDEVGPYTPSQQPYTTANSSDSDRNSSYTPPTQQTYTTANSSDSDRNRSYTPPTQQTYTTANSSDSDRNSSYTPPTQQTYTTANSSDSDTNRSYTPPPQQTYTTANSSDSDTNRSYTPPPQQPYTTANSSDSDRNRSYTPPPQQTYTTANSSDSDGNRSYTPPPQQPSTTANSTIDIYTYETVAENKGIVLNCTKDRFNGKHEWSRKDGEPAVTTTRILTEDTRLNITHASVEDAGEYICRNGPTVTHRFVITVEVFVKVQMIVKVLNYEYTPELQNKSSQAFIETERNFTAEMDKLYKNTPGYVRTEVLNFTKGSVNVDFRVIIVINATDPKNASAIPDAKAKTTHQVVREAKTGFVKQLQVSPVVEVFSPPLEPRGIEIFEEKSDKLGVRWEPSEDADAFKVQSYHVQYRELLTKIPQNASVPSTEKKDTYTYLIQDLEPKTTYMIRVGAENRHGINFNEERAHKTLAPPFAKWIIVLIVLGILLVTGIIVGLIVFTRRRAEQRRKKLKEEEDGRFGGLSGDVRLASVPNYETRNVKGIKFSFANKSFMPSEANWKEIPYEKITLMNELGSGAFGVVYKGELKQDNGNVTPCAVKTLKESATTEEMRDLYNELEIMTNVGYHPNLVNLLGACTQDGPLLVVIEIAENGNLLELLRKSRETNQNYGNIQGTVLTSDTRLRIAADVAKGMAHLANGRWIHRDLAARNVLLAKNYVAKVADYGMARDIYEQLMYKKETQGKLPVKWMAIESLETYIFTTESDVWSYGVLLWEMESGGLKPYAGLSTTELIDQLKKGYRLEKPDGCSDAVYQIMRDCWNPNPKSRPTFDDLVTRLENMAVSS